ncbi:MAG: phosphoribosyltransferase family protein [Candidatus Dasytiphilus stammeri]
MINISWDKIKKLSINIASVIKQRNIKYDCIIGLSRSGWIPAVIIAHYLGFRKLTSISVIRNITDDINSAKIPPKIEEIGPIAEKCHNWLIIDDIVGSGETIKYIRKTFSLPNRSIFVASLFFNSLNGDINHINKYVDYYAKEEQEWIRFPWEISLEY